MMKKFLFIFFVLALGILSGCQTEPEAVLAPTVAPAVVDVNQTASTTPDLDENAIMAILAASHNQDSTKYELHDVKKNGNYAVGRWSVDDNLSAETFWASKDQASWRLVYVGREMPSCEQLASWPTEIKAGCRDDLNSRQISNFSQCVTAGGQITETKPRRCFDKKGNIFVEILVGPTNKRYISQDLNKCQDLDFDCAVREKRFMDNLGCGCQTSVEIVKNFCQTTDRVGEVCAQLYTPTCGWFKSTVKCLRYPCAQNFANPCEACHNVQVESWTSGECPK